MKKVVSFLLGVLLLVVPFAGCKEKAEKPFIGAYYAESKWLFKDGEKEETLFSVRNAFSITVYVYPDFSQGEIEPLYLYRDEMDRMQTLLGGVLGEKTAMHKDENAKGGDIRLTTYDVYGEQKTLFIRRDGSIIFETEGKERYVSEAGICYYDGLIESFGLWKRTHPYKLQKTDGVLVFSQDGQEKSTAIDFQNALSCSIGRAADGGRSPLPTLLQREMLVEAMRLTDGQTFRATAEIPLATESIVASLGFEGVEYYLFVQPDGSISVSKQNDDEYYISTCGVVNYSLFLNLYLEWA